MVPPPRPPPPRRRLGPPRTQQLPLCLLSRLELSCFALSISSQGQLPGLLFWPRVLFFRAHGVTSCQCLIHEYSKSAPVVPLPNYSLSLVLKNFVYLSCGIFLRGTVFSCLNLLMGCYSLNGTECQDRMETRAGFLSVLTVRQKARQERRELGRYRSWQGVPPEGPPHSTHLAVSLWRQHPGTGRMKFAVLVAMV